jgi:hypothetical protein
VSKHFKLGINRFTLANYSDLRGRWDLPDGDFPTFVTFTDLNDPKSARVVAPSEFERVFGPGVQLKRVEIEMTRERATKRIEKLMPWLLHVERYRTDPNNPFSNTLKFGRPLFIWGT